MTNLIVGTVAFDAIETPYGKTDKILMFFFVANIFYYFMLCIIFASDFKTFLLSSAG